MRCIGTLIGMVVMCIVGFGIVLGGILLLKQLTPPPPPDQQLYAAPNRWGGQG